MFCYNMIEMKVGGTLMVDKDRKSFRHGFKNIEKNFGKGAIMKLGIRQIPRFQPFHRVP